MELQVCDLEHPQRPGASLDLALKSMRITASLQLLEVSPELARRLNPEAFNAFPRPGG